MNSFKKYCCIILVLCIVACKEQAAINILGKVSNMDGVTARLTSSDLKTIYDSTIVKNGAFIFHTDMPEKGFYIIDFKSPMVNRRGWAHSCLFYAENNAKYTFIANNPDEILYNRYQIISTCFEQKKLNEFNEIVKTKADSIKLIRKRYLKLADDALNNNKNSLYSSYLDSITLADNSINKSGIESIHLFVKNNHNTIMVPHLISISNDLFENYALYESALKQLPPDIKVSKYYQEANDLLQSTQKINIGTVAPLLAGKNLNGSDFKMTYAGKKIILLDFWASYCVPCREQMPELKALYNKYKNKGLEIVSVSIDEDPLKWGRASRQEEIPWYNVAECVDQSDSKNVKNFVIKSIPANYVLNSKGEFIGRNLSIDSVERMIVTANAPKTNKTAGL